ncbi:WG repeat-containing protein [Micromonospora sp. CPCC 205711]|uniref:WG repeat-containing protein n=1 Tax=Micromonospora sp. CPCC 205547 TaxID=3122400 RepID=UPI002FF2BCE1
MSGPPAQVSGPPAQVSGPPAQVSGPPAPISAPPARPWGPAAPVSGPPMQVSAPPTPAPASPGWADEASTWARADEASTWADEAPAPVSAPPAVVPTRPSDEPMGVRPVSAPPSPGPADEPAPMATTGGPARAATPADEPAPVSAAPADEPERTARDASTSGTEGAVGEQPEPVAEARPVSAPPGLKPPASAFPAGDQEPPVAGDAAPTPKPVPDGDPEQILAGYHWRLDPETLREVVDDPDELRTIRRRLTEKLGASLDNRARARLLSLRAVVSRLVDDLNDALADGRLALTYAEATGELRRTALARARLAEVLRWKGEFAEADRLFAEANSTELPARLRAALHEHAGRSCYDQGRLMEACEHFERALGLHRAEDPELTGRIRVALDAVHVRAAAGGGFGPYPRGAEEVRRGRRSPVPTHDGALDRWGYADAEGELALGYQFAAAQPFADGMAWVRRPDAPGWELIDESGNRLLGPSYAAVRPFSDGLAWVSPEGGTDWTAIEPDGTEAVPPGFDEVRPFVGGVAAVRRGGWGAVDRNGRMVVRPQYHGFATALVDGRRIDGFTAEGLAVLDAGGRRGVVDRRGKWVVPPEHPAIVIHPVAFLVADAAGRWGALDRGGAPLIDPRHPSRDAVVAELDLLLTDTHPVL